MNICSSCGHENPNENRFCESCGSLLSARNGSGFEPVVNSQMNEGNVCSSCGTVNPDNNRFCVSCGAPLSNRTTAGFDAPKHDAPLYNAPVYNAPTNNQADYSQKSSTAYSSASASASPNAPMKHSTMSIIAMICSVLCCLGFVGLALGIIDLVNAKNEKTPQKHTFSIIAIVIGGFMTLVCLYSYVSGLSNNSSGTKSTQIETTVTTAIEETTTVEETTTTTTEETTTTTTVDLVDSYTADMDTQTASAFLSGLSYLDYMAFSRQGLIDQLSSPYADNYTVEQATAAVDAIESYGLVDWDNEAVKSAESYLNFTAFSRQGLIDQLTSEYGEQFTDEQATYAVDYLEDNGLVDWNEQAVKSAESYLSMFSFSRSELIDQLTSEYGEQFTSEQAEYAADQLGL